jgi:hypothetical protein
VAATLALVALVAAIAAGGLWWAQQGDSSESGDPGAGSSGPQPERDSGRENGNTGAELGEQAQETASDDPRVVVITVDGLGSAWVSRQSTPMIAALLGNGAATLEARTEREMTVTLPNHTGMVTGLPVDAARGGHGVTWNETDPRSVRPGVASVFSVVAGAGGSSAVFAGKEKFEMWGRAWPGAIDELVIDGDQPTLVDRAIHDITSTDRELTFLHLAGPDTAGHRTGWGSEGYLRAVEQADSDIASVVDAVTADPRLAEDVVLVITADHGGVPGEIAHGRADEPTSYRIPFLVWGPGVVPGELYALNPDYRDPGARRPGYRGPQPVRNGDVANVVTDLLGLEPVPGSRFDAEHDLDIDRD